LIVNVHRRLGPTLHHVGGRKGGAFYHSRQLSALLSAEIRQHVVCARPGPRPADPDPNAHEVRPTAALGQRLDAVVPAMPAAHPDTGDQPQHYQVRLRDPETRRQ